MSYPVPGPALDAAARSPRIDAPLVLLFERDDAMAVPLLSQLRLAGYDVRAARTPVDLFDAAQKHTVALIVVDLSNAAASRREFWVALDAQRRGRATQVLTFRVVTPNTPLLADLDAAPHALADLEVGGPQEVALLVAAVSQRVPFGADYAVPGTPAAIGMTGYPAPGPAPAATSWGEAPSSPFASPAPGNPFSAATANLPFANSPFDQPDARNPFEPTQPRTQPAPSDMTPSSEFGLPVPPPATGPAWPPHSFSRQSGSSGRIPAMPATPVPPSGAPGFPPVLGPSANSFDAQSPFLASQGRSPDRTSSSGHAPEGADSFDSPTSVSDAWMPPDGVLPLDVSASDDAGRDVMSTVHAASTSGAMTEPRLGSNGHGPADQITPVASPHNEDLSQAERSTAPVAVRPHAATGGALIRPEERALGAVLVEGALLSPQRLEVLAEIRQMLTAVDVDIKLGELALLFRFLSPDQLLAALLVSRRLITPEQIAALGRIKQEMGASGINYDLETLLVMFNIMSREDLERLRGELA